MKGATLTGNELIAGGGIQAETGWTLGVMIRQKPGN